MNIQKAKLPTSSSVAKLAGVSQSAVSRCFTKGASISNRTKLRVIEAAKKLGDVAGRKLIWPGAGTRSEWDYDFVQAVFTSTIADYGKNWVNFWENSEDMPELQALQALGGSCANERTFGVIPVK